MVYCQQCEWEFVGVTRVYGVTCQALMMPENVRVC